MIKMDISTIQPVPNEPALFLKKKKLLVFADLHIGIESQLKEQGIITKSRTDKMIKRLFSICKKYKPEDIILLGDIKHNIPWSTIQERKDVKNFISLIKEFGNIHNKTLETLIEEKKDRLLFLDFRDPSKLPGNCGSCANNSSCFGCRSSAYYYEGDIMAADPKCYHFNPDKIQEED